MRVMIQRILLIICLIFISSQRQQLFANFLSEFFISIQLWVCSLTHLRKFYAVETRLCVIKPKTILMNSSSMGHWLCVILVAFNLFRRKHLCYAIKRGIYSSCSFQYVVSHWVSVRSFASTRHTQKKKQKVSVRVQWQKISQKRMTESFGLQFLLKKRKRKKKKMTLKFVGCFLISFCNLK